MRRHRRKIHPTFLVAGIIGCLATIACQPREQAAAPPAALPEVATVTVVPRQILLTTELPGRTAARRVADIRPQVNGLIQKRFFTEGADVKAGDVLYQIDPASFRAALNNAEAALGKSEANLPPIRSRVERYRELLAEKAVSQQDYEDAAAALKLAESDIRYWQATVESARINLAYTRIAAPISGRIGRSSVTEGAIVTAYQPQALATIQQLDPIYVDVPQSTSDLLRLKLRLAGGGLSQKGENQKTVNLVLEDGTPYPLEGTLQFQEVTVDPSTGSVILRAEFPNPEGLLLPNMFVRAVMKEGVTGQAIMIPQQAVARDSKGNPVALIVDGEEKVQQRMLTVDRAIGDQWLVTGGLDPGERVIVEGLQKVRPGASVKATPAATDSAAGDAPTQNTAQASPTAN